MPVDMDVTFRIYKARNNDEIFDHDNSIWYFEELKQARSNSSADSFLADEIAHNYKFITGCDMPEGFIEDIKIESNNTQIKSMNSGSYSVDKLRYISYNCTEE